MLRWMKEPRFNGAYREAAAKLIVLAISRLARTSIAWDNFSSETTAVKNTI
jgi:hypothetical protein